MRVSVVIASYNVPETLRRCLASLATQDAEEVIVADASLEDPSAWIAREFPAVRLIRFAEEKSVPELRSAGVRVATGDVIATTEGWMLLPADWIAELRAVHADRPEGVIGCGIGFPAPGESAGYFAWAEFFSEYGFHAAPVRAGPAAELTGPSLSYKAETLARATDLIEQGAWDTWVLERLRAEGQSFWRTDRYALHYAYSRPMSQTIRQRFHYGRWFAAERFAGRTGIRQLARAACFPLAAGVLFGRLWRGLAGKQMRGRLLATAPCVLALFACWGLGEAAGMLMGPGSEAQRNF